MIAQPILTGSEIRAEGTLDELEQVLTATFQDLEQDYYQFVDLTLFVVDQAVQCLFRLDRGALQAVCVAIEPVATDTTGG